MEKTFTLTCYSCQTSQTIEAGNLEPECRNCHQTIAYSKTCLSCAHKFWGRKYYSLCKKCVNCPKCGIYTESRYCPNCENTICHLCKIKPISKSWLDLFKTNSASQYKLCNDCYTIKKCLTCNKIKAYDCSYCYNCAHAVKCRDCNNLKIKDGTLCQECDLKAKCIQCKKEYKYFNDYCRNCNAELKCITCNIRNRTYNNEFCSECVICSSCLTKCEYSRTSINNKIACHDCYEIYQRLSKCHKIAKEPFIFSCFEREMSNYDGYESDPYNIEYEIIAQITIKFPYRLDLNEVESMMPNLYDDDKKYINFTEELEPTLPIYDFTNF